MKGSTGPKMLGAEVFRTESLLPVQFGNVGNSGLSRRSIDFFLKGVYSLFYISLSDLRFLSVGLASLGYWPGSRGRRAGFGADRCREPGDPV